MEKVKVRINNSHKHIWAVVWNGQPEDFSDAKDITLIASVRDKRINLTQGIDYVIEGNLVKIDFTPRFCKNTGVYNIELNYTKPSESFLSGERRTAVDLNVIEIVGTSACADATDETSSVSEAAFGFQGLSAYEVWLKDNPGKTKEDYFNWLQKPATDIAETVNLQEQARVESENTRKNNEEQRVEAEGLRASGEVARNTAEGIRVSSENTRIENEGARELAENERATAEAVRVQAENERETAETTRISNENNRVTAEQERVNAESLRVTAESSRELAESLRVDAEIVREQQEQDRQTNTATAITNAETATTQATTAAEQADTARLAIEDDLGLPIGNLISQLFANFYLNDFDHFVHETLGFEKYGRYVDDFYIIGDKKKILKAIPLIREKLKDVGIALHPHKFYLQHASKGCEMVGAVVKKDRIYVHNRTVNNAFRKIERMTQHKRSATEKDLASVNSYLGFMGMYSSYNIRRRLAINAMKLDGLTAPNNYKKMKLSKQYNYERNK